MSLLLASASSIASRTERGRCSAMSTPTRSSAGKGPLSALKSGATCGTLSRKPCGAGPGTLSWPGAAGAGGGSTSAPGCWTCGVRTAGPCCAEGAGLAGAVGGTEGCAGCWLCAGAAGFVDCCVCDCVGADVCWPCDGGCGDGGLLAEGAGCCVVWVVEVDDCCDAEAGDAPAPSRGVIFSATNA